jgi:two-component system, OmpR family, alkaline phosphatase synthesis response regulator PhoP
MLRVRHLKTQLDRTLAYLAEFEAASRASTAEP